MEMRKEMNQYLEFCQYRKELSRNTVKAYRIDLEQFLRYVEEDAFLRSKIEAYITELHKKYKEKTALIYHFLMHSIVLFHQLQDIMVPDLYTPLLAALAENPDDPIVQIDILPF